MIKTWFFTRVRSICWILPFNEQSQARGLGTHMGEAPFLWAGIENVGAAYFPIPRPF